MSSPVANSRRQFLHAFGSLIAGSFGVVASSKTSSAAIKKGVFASQFLEEGRIVDLPAGHYDPEQKLTVRTSSSRPIVSQERMTGVWTYSYERKCRYMEFPEDAPPHCGEYYEDLVRHPDGFRPESQEEDIFY